jgi:hypothetical protein
MTKKDILQHLEAVAKQIGVKVIYDELRGDGGLCRCKDRHFLILNSRLSQGQKIDLLIQGLANFDLNGVSLMPEARILLERQMVLNKQPAEVMVRELVPTGS